MSKIKQLLKNQSGGLLALGFVASVISVNEHYKIVYIPTTSFISQRNDAPISLEIETKIKQQKFINEEEVLIYVLKNKIGDITVEELNELSAKLQKGK